MLAMTRMNPARMKELYEVVNGRIYLETEGGSFGVMAWVSRWKDGSYHIGAESDNQHWKDFHCFQASRIYGYGAGNQAYRPKAKELKQLTARVEADLMADRFEIRVPVTDAWGVVGA